MKVPPFIVENQENVEKEKDAGENVEAAKGLSGRAGIGGGGDNRNVEVEDAGS